jgi:uncharacterized protein YxjI
MTKHIKDLQDYLVPHIKPSKTTYTVFRLIKNQENITGNPIAVMHEGQCYELTGWDFKFNKDGKELAHVSKKWAGIGKEFFTSADNYVLQINEVVTQDAPIRPLILAAVMCIDMVLKEK